jgi:hypothetical protein
VIRQPAWDKLRFVLLALMLLLPRLTHRQILWVEEAYPAAAAIQMEHGAALYRDFQFDKPPLSAAVYRLWGARTDWPLRLAGAIYAGLCCWLAFLIAGHWWSAREGWLAAWLLGVYLTFGIPAAVMALAPDLLSVLPILCAVLALIRGWTFAAGLCLGVAAAGVNGKCLLLIPLLALFRPVGGALGGLAVGAAIPVLLFGSGAAMWEQVWTWGTAYSRDTPVTAPLREGLLRTLTWGGFQATAVAGAGWLLLQRERAPRLLAVWMALSLAIVCLGLRFSPRYYLILLAPVCLAAARGLSLMPARGRWALLALLAIPVLRFGPKYAELARTPDLEWPDTAMNRDSAAAARIVNAHAQPGDTILVWGYRPDILVYTRLKLGTPFLDSQPLTGVLADRHLSRADATFPALAARNRERLATLSPTWVLDGLGPYNPKLAISRYPELETWQARYELAGETAGTRIFRLRR